MRKRFPYLLLLLFATAVASFLLPGCGDDSGTLGKGQTSALGSGGSGTVDGGTVSGADLSACEGACVDLMIDSENCGACGNACSAGQQCKSGSCQGCAPGQEDCSGLCINTGTDRNNCGACGNSCPLGAECVDGVCESCGEGQEDCDGTCVNTEHNPSNCGACGNVCGDNEVCSAGSCVENTCGGSNQLPCGDAGMCVDIIHNKDHCGACGQVCPGDMACIPVSVDGGGDGLSRCGCYSGEPCSGVCTETKTDVNNCGGCGIQCPSAQYCEQGVCRCGGGLVLCGGECKVPEQCSGGTNGAALPTNEPFSSSFRRPSALGDGSAECGMPVAGGDGDLTDPDNPGATGGGASVGDGDGDGDGGTTPPVTNPGAGEHCGGGDWTEGKATWYELATDLVHCGYPTPSLPQYYGAINDAQYAVGDVCGACVEVEAAGKSLVIEIVDECPYEGNETWCYAGSNHIDLNPAAFQYFHDAVKGWFEMKWRYVPCEAPGELEYTFKAGSSIYWAAIMIRNHPVPLASVEIAGPDGVFQSLPRQEYNFWLAEAGLGEGPYTLRVTDTSGAVLEKTGIPSLPKAELSTNETSAVGSQIASCQ